MDNATSSFEVGIALGLAVGVVLHEAAHALVAAAIGLGARSVQIGRYGPAVRFAVRGCTVELHLIPLGGLTTNLRRAAFTWQTLLATGAGPLVNLAICWAALVGLPQSGGEFGFGVVLMNAALFVENLVPLRRRTVAGGRAPSDGLQMIRAIRQRAGRSRWSTTWTEAQLPTVGLLLQAAAAVASDAGAPEVSPTHIARALIDVTVSPLLPVGGAGWALWPDDGLPLQRRCRVHPDSAAKKVTRRAIGLAAVDGTQLTHLHLAQALMEDEPLSGEIKRRRFSHAEAVTGVSELSAYIQADARRFLRAKAKGSPPSSYWDDAKTELAKAHAALAAATRPTTTTDSQRFDVP